MVTWLEIVCEAIFDPLDAADRFTSSFLFIDGDFVQVPYQGHKKVLAAHFKVPYVSFNDSVAFKEFLDDMTRLIAQHGIVEGSLTRPAKGVRGSMGLVGTLPAIRRAWAAFRLRWPDMLAQIEAVSYDVLDANGQRLDSDFIEGSKIDRKFGRRSRPAADTIRPR